MTTTRALDRCTVENYRQQYQRLSPKAQARLDEAAKLRALQAQVADNIERLESGRPMVRHGRTLFVPFEFVAQAMAEVAAPPPAGSGKVWQRPDVPAGNPAGFVSREEQDRLRARATEIIDLLTRGLWSPDAQARLEAELDSIQRILLAGAAGPASADSTSGLMAPDLMQKVDQAIAAINAYIASRLLAPATLKALEAARDALVEFSLRA